VYLQHCGEHLGIRLGRGGLFIGHDDDRIHAVEAQVEIESKV
jgi:hypothetical protein